MVSLWRIVDREFDIICSCGRVIDPDDARRQIRNGDRPICDICRIYAAVSIPDDVDLMIEEVD